MNDAKNPNDIIYELISAAFSLSIMVPIPALKDRSTLIKPKTASGLI